MRTWKTIAGLTLVGLLLACPSAHAQRPNRNAGSPQQQADKPAPPPLPSDRRLLALHRSFVSQAEKLALEYERDRDWDKAKTVYTEILKLVPAYEPAQVKLAAIRQLEATAQRVTFRVQADQGLQDTGVRVLAGKPLTVRARGSWVFNFSAELTADGMKIPEELKKYNLGSLIGFIDSGTGEEPRPFVIGQEKTWVPERSGRLLVQMYDNDPRDNQGGLQLEITGTFDER